jgi:hypothetical protein
MALQTGATRTIVRMFDDRDHALMAVRDLERAGFTQDEVSLMTTGGGDTTTTTSTDTTADETGSGAGMGATLGTLLGGGAGLLAGIGALAIPGLGPIVAAGWLAAALTGGVAGAAAGGLLGSLVGSGVDEKEAHVYAEGMRRGGTLLSVRGTESRITEAERIMASHQAVDMSAREAEYRSTGWSGYSTDGDSGDPPGTAAGRAADRAMGTNVSGAYPHQSDGTRANPAGTAASRAASGTATGTMGTGQITPRADDDGKVIPRQPDGAPGNPPGTEVSRGVDEALGTNVSGAHPENERRR